MSLIGLTQYSHLQQFAWHAATARIAALQESELAGGGAAASAIMTAETVQSQSLSSSSLRRQLVRMLAHWALLNGEVGRLLDAVFDDEVSHFVLCVAMDRLEIITSR